MQVPSVSVRFGLILEAYCRGSQEHMVILTGQLECLDKLKKCSEAIRFKRDKDKVKQHMQESAKAINAIIDRNKSIKSPLDPSYACKEIR